MRKYLILTVTAGEGHNSMARAIKEKLEKEPNTEVKVIDIFKSYGKRGKVFFINDGYFAACKYALPIYNVMFRSMQMASPDEKNKTVAQSWLDHETPLLLNDIYSFKPDVIIGTHFYSGIMITNLKRKHSIPAKVVSLLTDYTVHPFHECATKIDYLITPTEILHPQLKLKGYQTKQLVPLGIPVKEEFSIKQTKQAAREKLGLNKDLFTVFISVGGGGFGDSTKLLKKLLRIEAPLQIIIVNGKNKQNYKKIESIIENANTNHKIINYGYVNFIHEIMSASDCIVGKCGATSLNEALNKGKVLILNDKLAQQEYDNMMYLSSNSACIRISKYFPVELIIEHLMRHPEVLTKMEENINKIRKPNALNDICEFVKKLKSEPYTNKIKLLSKEELKELRQEIKKSLSEETQQIKELNKHRKYLDKLYKDKEVIKAEKKEEKEKKEQYLHAVKQTKSTIYTGSNNLIDATPELLGVSKLKKKDFKNED